MVSFTILCLQLCFVNINTLLDKASMLEVKEYLRKHQLYKSGSNAPPEILREIYKSAHLAGHPVINKSKDNLIHNFYKL